MNTKLIGDYGERLAAEYLNRKGYRIIDRNYRAKSGEIDIISFDGRTLVFIEVKTRKNSEFAFAREAVNKKKQQRIKNTARDYISKKYCNYEEIRFDVVEIYTDEKTIQHFENSF
ncbi:MAG: YraN family protein [Proteocatella sp.]